MNQRPAHVSGKEPKNDTEQHRKNRANENAARELHNLTVEISVLPPCQLRCPTVPAVKTNSAGFKSWLSEKTKTTLKR